MRAILILSVFAIAGCQGGAASPIAGSQASTQAGLAISEDPPLTELIDRKQGEFVTPEMRFRPDVSELQRKLPTTEIWPQHLDCGGRSLCAGGPFAAGLWKVACVDPSNSTTGVFDDCTRFVEWSLGSVFHPRYVLKWRRDRNAELYTNEIAYAVDVTSLIEASDNTVVHVISRSFDEPIYHVVVSHQDQGTFDHLIEYGSECQKRSISASAVPGLTAERPGFNSTLRPSCDLDELSGLYDVAEVDLKHLAEAALRGRPIREWTLIESDLQKSDQE